MKSQSQKIVFFGTEDFSLVALKRLVEAGYPVVAVVTKPDSRRGRHQEITSPVVKTYALDHNIVVWQPAQVRDITNNVISLGATTGVLVSYGKIIPQSIIDLFTPGIINVHPSLLPRYRGPSPIESAIANGDKQTGVSIMQLSAGMDAGPVYTQVHHPLNQHETQPALYDELADLGASTLLAALPHIINRSMNPAPQDDLAATYSHLLDKTHALIDPTLITASAAERRVRAYLQFPKTKVIIGNQTVIITKCHVASNQKTPLDVLCQDGVFLAIDELIAPSGRTMTAAAFLNGYTAA